MNKKEEVKVNITQKLYYYIILSVTQDNNMLEVGIIYDYQATHIRI